MICGICIGSRRRRWNVGSSCSNNDALLLNLQICWGFVVVVVVLVVDENDDDDDGDKKGTRSNGAKNVYRVSLWSIRYSDYMRHDTHNALFINLCKYAYASPCLSDAYYQAS